MDLYGNPYLVRNKVFATINGDIDAAMHRQPAPQDGTRSVVEALDLSRTHKLIEWLRTEVTA
jgi:hypothetical protein